MLSRSKLELSHNLTRSSPYSTEILQNLNCTESEVVQSTLSLSWHSQNRTWILQWISSQVPQSRPNESRSKLRCHTKILHWISQSVTQVAVLILHWILSKYRREPRYCNESHLNRSYQICSISRKVFPQLQQFSPEVLVCLVKCSLKFSLEQCFNTKKWILVYRNDV